MRFVYRKGVGAAIVGCTNVFNGKAYVYDEYGGSDRSYFIYDALRKSDLEKTGRVKILQWIIFIAINRFPEGQKKFHLKR